MNIDRIEKQLSIVASLIAALGAIASVGMWLIPGGPASPSNPVPVSAPTTPTDPVPAIRPITPPPVATPPESPTGDSMWVRLQYVLIVGNFLSAGVTALMIPWFDSNDDAFAVPMVFGALFVLAGGIYVLAILVLGVSAYVARGETGSFFEITRSLLMAVSVLFNAVMLCRIERH